MPDQTPDQLFWEIAEEMYSDSKVSEGTMMGFKCLRVEDDFFATIDHKKHALIIKLPKDRVKTLVDSEVGRPFAPNGRVFKEWVSIPKPDAKRWRKFLNEAKEFVLSS